jgi:penicillin-binding protein 1A
MRVALDGEPETHMERPPGLITVRIDPTTGLLAGADDPDAIFESFREGNAPGHVPGYSAGGSRRPPDTSLPEQLF